MGGCLQKQPGAQEAEIGVTGESSRQEKKPTELVNEVYLPYPKKPGEVVDFGVRLDDIDGKLILTETAGNSLARDAGIHDGDALVDINDTDIEGRSVQYILDFLREKVKRRILLTVKRQVDEDKHVFVWTYFEIVINKENQPEVYLLYLTRTDENILPWIGVLESDEYAFLRVLPNTFDIFLKGDPSFYLSVDCGNVEFVSTYKKETCAFYKYLYIGSGRAEDGLPVVYSLQEHEKPVVDSTTPGAQADSGHNPKIEAMNFPETMVNNPVALNPRFWYQRANGEGEFSLQSIEQKGWYLSKSTSSDDAVLVDKAEYFTIQDS